MYKVGVVVLTLLLSLGLTSTAMGASAPATPKLTKPVALALIEAQKQAAAKNFAVVLEQAKVALAASVTPWDRFQSQQMLAYAQVQLKDNAAAADTFEALIASGLLPPEESKTRGRNVCQLRYQLKDWTRAIKACGDYSKQYNEREMGYLVPQIYYQQKNCPAAIDAIKVAIAGDPKPPKPLLQMLGRCNVEAKNGEGTQNAYEQMVTYYPDNAYWEDLLSMAQVKVRNSSRYDLEILRLRAATGVIEVPTEIVDLAETALQVGLPGEAKSTLERALAAGQIGTGAQKSAHMALLANARTQAAEDLKNLIKDEVEAKKAPKGEPDLRLGEALVSHGRYDQGIAAMQRGIGKGGLKDPVEAKLRLGLALLQAGKKQEAIAALNEAKGPGNYAFIARLWAIQIHNAMKPTAGATAGSATAEEEAEEAQDAKAEEEAGRGT